MKLSCGGGGWLLFAARPPGRYTARMLPDLLLRVLNWVTQNPITFLTAILVVVTYAYTRQMARSVKILSDQFAAQIRPEVNVTLTDQSWSDGKLKATLVVTATRNTAVLRGGEITVYCEHDEPGDVVELGILEGHTLPSGESLRLAVSGEFDCTAPHVHGAGIGGSVLFSDYKRHINYEYDIRGDWHFVKVRTPRALGVAAILRPFVKLVRWVKVKRLVRRMSKRQR